MSDRSIYLRDQAAKCRWHANNIGDTQTQVALRKLAAVYVAEAEDIEAKAGGKGDKLVPTPNRQIQRLILSEQTRPPRGNC
jgi:hypothetical protein